MEKYVRTKDGKIFDLTECCKESKNTIIDKHSNWLNEKDIVKQSETIEELIEVGDLTNYGYVHDLGKGDAIFRCRNEWLYLEHITEFYIKQGDNYILAAKKENGEWRVI